MVTPVNTNNWSSLQDKAQSLLEQCFGYTEFRKGQWIVIENILNKRNTIAVFPTGGGKSLCYQLPALMMPGTTIVISPLISLMKDQVDSLVEKGIAATFISSTLSDSETARRVNDMEKGLYKIVYIAPERFQSDAFNAALKNIHIPFIAVDEAHCISQWGHNFRPSYLKIRDVIQLAGCPVVAAFTATANKKVQEDMIELLGLSECRLFIGSFDRPNLEFRIEEPKSPDSFVLNYVRSHPGKSGIVYASTRKTVEDLYFYLKNNGVKAGMYHAGLTAEQRNRYQDSFITGEAQVMVATNAFGMGIDKSDVRFIIHYNMPISMENYYQEAGRAGRDGRDSVCILLKNPEDYRLNKFLIDSNYPPVKVVENLFDKLIKRKKTGIPVEALINRRASGAAVRESALKKIVEYGYAEIRGGIVYPLERERFELTQKDIDVHKSIEMDKLDAMQRYFEETTCLRAYILRYFNEEPPEKRCGNCSLCYRSPGQDNSRKMHRILTRIFGE
ncbi:MAG TPA: ATP-dependent DNA helicase RecQ [Clostridiales bacterium]|nr:ATP-dependent DNA helicase RecQ [Clostridiales bacterium]